MEDIDEIRAKTRLSPACSLMLEEIFRSLDNAGRGVLTEKEFKFWGLCWTGTTMGAHSVRWMMKRVSLTEDFTEITLDEWMEYGMRLADAAPNPEDILRAAQAKINAMRDRRDVMKRIQDVKAEIAGLKEDIAMESLGSK